MTAIARTTMKQDEQTKLDDDVLMCRIIDGDTDAFTTLYDRYHGRLAGFLKRYLQQPESIEEVVNDVMLALWRQRADYDHTRPLSSWLFGIARYQALTARRRATPFVPDVIEWGDTQAEGPEVDVERDQERDRVRQAVQTLPSGLRTVVQLAYHEYYSYPEIAERLNCPVNTIKDRMRQARHRLKPILTAPERDKHSQAQAAPSFAA